MADTKVFSFPENGSGGSGNDLATLLALSNGNNGGLFGGNSGWGGGILGFFLGLLFGNNGLFGNGFGGGNNGAGFLSNQINNDNGRDLLMQAITSQGERNHDAVMQLATALGQDFNLVNSSIQAISTALNQVANAQGMNALQVINAIQSGNASLASQLSQCCCQNQLALCQQTNTLQTAINSGFNGVTMGIGGLSRQIEAKSAADQLAVCQQTYQLTDGANRNTQAILSKMDAIEDARKDREIDALQTENTTLKSQNFMAGMMAQTVAPINASLAALSKEVDDIKCKQPQTVAVQWPNLTAVNTTPYVSGGFYGNGFYGNGFGNNIIF